MNSRTINRRTMLKGIGGVTIGLPLLEEMLGSTAMAAAKGDAIPVRAFNVFFGLGIPAPLQTEGFDGVLEPLKPLSDKLLIMRNVDQVRCDEKGINAHFDGASGAFTAEPPDGEAKSGGPSIDQVIRQTRYPKGLPADVVPTLVAGTFFRRSRISRYVHSYNQDGTVAGVMQEKPRDLFNRVFGTVALVEGANSPEQRLKQSVLDSVVDQYRFYSGQNSPLGKASKSRLGDHLDRIREYEQRAFSHQRAEGAPSLPPRSHLLHGGTADPGGQGIDITLEELTREWRLMADLYALAIKTGKVQFGSLTFLAAGERIRLTGEYQYDGRKVWDFNDAKQLNASGDKGLQSRVVAQIQREEAKRTTPCSCPHEDARGRLLPPSPERQGSGRGERPHHFRKLADHHQHRIWRWSPQQRQARTLWRLPRHHGRRRAFQNRADS